MEHGATPLTQESVDQERTRLLFGCLQYNNDHFTAAVQAVPCLFFETYKTYAKYPKRLSFGAREGRGSTSYHGKLS